ncbi:MAG: ORF6N domain-containing protein [Acidobacteriia bacterium]|nr:ORF6N domain-containing protein [Terriglobia bacterium]
MVDDQSLIPVGYIQQLIYWIRGQRVMLDADLAKIYGVSTTRLNQQVSRNRGRFPVDFMFQLTRGEFHGLMLQFATSNARRGGRRKLPYAFTEHGAIMLATVLNSPAAVGASVQVVRAFVQLRRLLTSHGELARKLTDLERTLLRHDSQFKEVFDAIRQLMAPPRPKRRRIGFGARNP